MSNPDSAPKPPTIDLLPDTVEELEPKIEEMKLLLGKMRRTLNKLKGAVGTDEDEIDLDTSFTDALQGEGMVKSFELEVLKAEAKLKRLKEK